MARINRFAAHLIQRTEHAIIRQFKTSYPFGLSGYI